MRIKWRTTHHRQGRYVWACLDPYPSHVSSYLVVVFSPPFESRFLYFTAFLSHVALSSDGNVLHSADRSFACDLFKMLFYKTHYTLNAQHKHYITAITKYLRLVPFLNSFNGILLALLFLSLLRLLIGTFAPADDKTSCLTLLSHLFHHKP